MPKGYDDAEDLEVEQLTLYLGSEGFLEFPEHDYDDFPDILERATPEKRRPTHTSSNVNKIIRRT